MPTLEQLRRQIVADHERLGALIVEYAKTLDPQVRQARDLLDAALREKTRILVALEQSASSKVQYIPPRQALHATDPRQDKVGPRLHTSHFTLPSERYPDVGV